MFASFFSLSSLPYLRSSKGTKEETDGREVQTFRYPFGKLLAGFPWLALPWPWALADSSDAGDSFTRSSSASIVEIRGKDLKDGFFFEKNWAKHLYSQTKSKALKAISSTIIDSDWYHKQPLQVDPKPNKDTLHIGHSQQVHLRTYPQDGPCHSSVPGQWAPSKESEMLWGLQVGIFQWHHMASQ